METKEEIKQFLEKMLKMNVIGYVVYPSCIIDVDETGFTLRSYYHEERELYLEARSVFESLFEVVKSKAKTKTSRSLWDCNKSTIVLQDVDRKKWYFNLFDHEFQVASEGCRQGWDYEFDPESDEDSKENHFHRDNLWFC